MIAVRSGVVDRREDPARHRQEVRRERPRGRPAGPPPAELDDDDDDAIAAARCSTPVAELLRGRRRQRAASAASSTWAAGDYQLRDHCNGATRRAAPRSAARRGAELSHRRRPGAAPGQPGARRAPDPRATRGQPLPARYHSLPAVVTTRNNGKGNVEAAGVEPAASVKRDLEPALLLDAQQGLGVAARLVGRTRSIARPSG